MTLIQTGRRLGQICKTLLVVYYAYMVEYRAELLFWVLSGTLPLILMGAWVQAANSGSLDLSPTDFIRYFLAVFIVRQFTIVWVIWEFETEVVEGKLSPLLLQPIDPAWRHFAMHVTERLARLPFVVVLLGLFALLYPEAVWIPPLGSVVKCLIAGVMAFVLRFLMQYTFAMGTFWMERAVAIEQVWFLFYLFLSGMVAPLEVFPPAVRAVVLWTPFPYLIHFPASVLVGLPVDFGRGLIVVTAWSLLFWLLNRWLWRLGLKHFSAMGA